MDACPHPSRASRASRDNMSTLFARNPGVLAANIAVRDDPAKAPVAQLSRAQVNVDFSRNPHALTFKVPSALQARFKRHGLWFWVVNPAVKRWTEGLFIKP